MATSWLRFVAHISFADLGGTLRNVVGSRLQKTVIRQFSDVVWASFELVDVILVKLRVRACSNTVRVLLSLCGEYTFVFFYF